MMDSKLSKPVAWTFKEYVWATGLCGHVWRDKLEDEAPDAECESVKDISPLYSQEYVAALRDVAVALREWVDAVPDGVSASLPTMPGIDRDWVDFIIGKEQSNG